LLSSTTNPCKVESQQPTASIDKIHKELQSPDTLKYLVLLMLSTTVPTLSIAAPIKTSTICWGDLHVGDLTIRQAPNIFCPLIAGKKGLATMLDM